MLVEDPFGVLSVFAPELSSRLYMTPLYPSQLATATQPQSQYDPSSSRPQSIPPHSPAPFPTMINLPLDHSPPDVSIPASTKRRHWVITRTLTRRGKEKDDDPEMPEVADLSSLREVQVADFGSFAPLTGALEEEMRRRGIITQEGNDEAKMFDILRHSLNCEATTDNGHAVLGSSEDAGFAATNYWNSKRAAAAEEYIRDLVYGGVDGLAYIRSLAEFVTIEQPVSVVVACGPRLP